MQTSSDPEVSGERGGTGSFAQLNVAKATL
jgi:hypothetical protein